MREQPFLYKEKTHQIIGIAFDILNTMGHGFPEKPYERALTVAFQEQAIPYVQQKRYHLNYHSVNVGEYIPDLIVFDSIIIEAKVIEKIGCHERGQILNYLRVTGYKVGLILNFKYAKLQWERIVLSHADLSGNHQSLLEN